MTRIQLRRGLVKARAAFVSDSMVFFIAYLVIVSGVPIIVDPMTFAPVSVQTQLAEWIVRCWGGDLLIGGLLSGYGLLSERIRIEQAGLALLSAGAAIFSIVVIVYTGWAALLPFLTYALYAVAAIARYRKLNKVMDGINFARHLPDKEK